MVFSKKSDIPTELHSHGAPKAMQPMFRLLERTWMETIWATREKFPRRLGGQRVLKRGGKGTGFAKMDVIFSCILKHFDIWI